MELLKTDVIPQGKWSHVGGTLDGRVEGVGLVYLDAPSFRAGAPSDYIGVWFIRSLDLGTHWEDVPPIRVSDVNLPAARQHISGPTMLPAGPFKVLIYNDGFADLPKDSRVMWKYLGATWAEVRENLGFDFGEIGRRFIESKLDEQ